MLKRLAIILDQNIHGTTVIAVDSGAASDILRYIMRDKVDTEFKEIRDLLKQNLRNRDKYCKVNVSDRAHNMFEMRFTRNGRNDRIYCQEVRAGKVRYIVMCALFEGKKSNEIPSKYRSRIETIAGYEYEYR